MCIADGRCRCCVTDPNIRLLVGPERAGIGYGIAGSGCGVIAVAAPMLGGLFMDMDDPSKPEQVGVNVAWFFAGSMALSTAVWLIVSSFASHRAKATRCR